MSEPLLVATLDTFDIARPGPIDASFVLANVLPGFIVYFAVATESGHKRLADNLRESGDFFQEHLGSTVPRSRIADILSGRRPPVRTSVLSASTQDQAIINKLFVDYKQEWYVTSLLPFIIAPKEFNGWADQLQNLVGPSNRRLVLSSTIGNSYCIMSTMWEHGMFIVSNKITRSELKERVERIARDHSLLLAVEEN